MAKSIAEKLLIKPGTTVFVWPSARLGLIGALPDGVGSSMGWRPRRPPSSSWTTPPH